MDYLHSYQPFTRIPVYLNCAGMWHMHVIWKDMERTPCTGSKKQQLHHLQNKPLYYRLLWSWWSSESTNNPSLVCELSRFNHVWLCDPMDCSPPDSSAHGVGCHALLPTQDQTQFFMSPALAGDSLSLAPPRDLILPYIVRFHGPSLMKSLCHQSLAPFSF